MKSIPAIASILLVLTGIMLYFYSQSKPTPVIVPAKTISPSPSSTIPKGWRTYTDSSFKYSISYPQEFIQEPNGDNSIIIFKKVSEPRQGASNFVYISVVPESEKESEGKIYNYSKNHIQSLLSMKVGEKKQLEGEIPALAEYVTYERKPDMTVGGKKTKVFINKKPWEFPNGTTEYRYIVEDAKKLYVIGGYITEGTSHAYSISKSTFDSILRTLTL